jgi:DNA invertase Pin-like site-specific DNA recombinase
MIPRKRIGKRALRALGTDPYLDQFISPLYCFLKEKVQNGIKAMSDQEKRQRRPAIGYTRTSSATNAGDDKDSVVRQRKAIQAYANRAGFRIVAWFDDPAVTGTDMIDTRPGFMAALEKITGNGVRTIIVETANRFARDLIVQETGWKRLHADGITLIAADSPDQFVDETPTAVLIRQILGAVAQFDKAMTVAKLRGARERKRRKTGGKVEGRKSYAETKPELVKLARELSEQRPRLSLRQISAELAAQGFVTSAGKKRSGGKPYSASAVVSMLER